MQIRNRFLLLAVFLTLGALSIAHAQDKSKRPSPPAEAKATIGDLTIDINYSSPAVKGRKIWGGLEPFDQVWRTGANEATTFEVNKDVTINGKPLPTGKYALFTIPKENGEWVLILNKEADQWGAFNYHQNQDALRVNVKISQAPELLERLKFEIDDKTGKVTFAWEKLTFSFDVKKA